MGRGVVRSAHASKPSLPTPPSQAFNADRAALVPARGPQNSVVAKMEALSTQVTDSGPHAGACMRAEVPQQRWHFRQRRQRRICNLTESKESCWVRTRPRRRLIQCLPADVAVGLHHLGRDVSDLSQSGTPFSASVVMPVYRPSWNRTSDRPAAVRIDSQALALWARPGGGGAAGSVDTSALVAGFGGPESVDTSPEMAGFALDSLGRSRPPTRMPAAFRLIGALDQPSRWIT